MTIGPMMYVVWVALAPLPAVGTDFSACDEMINYTTQLNAWPDGFQDQLREDPNYVEQDLVLVGSSVERIGAAAVSASIVGPPQRQRVFLRVDTHPGPRDAMELKVCDSWRIEGFGTLTPAQADQGGVRRADRIVVHFVPDPAFAPGGHHDG